MRSTGLTSLLIIRIKAFLLRPRVEVALNPPDVPAYSRINFILLSLTTATACTLHYCNIAPLKKHEGFFVQATAPVKLPARHCPSAG